MSNDPPVLDQERLHFAETVIEKFGTQMSPASREAILRQQVVLGMPPYEASLAAGAYTFEVKADPAKWPPGADPNRVIAAQSLHPDDSHISCVFRNGTQFPGRGQVRFKVSFRSGRAVQINALD